jgi:hypothetical protein
MTLEPDAFVGCIMRIKVKNRWKIMLAVRLHEKKSTGQNWGNFCEIGDFSRTFAKLPIDTLAMVAVKATGPDQEWRHDDHLKRDQRRLFNTNTRYQPGE